MSVGWIRQITPFDSARISGKRSMTREKHTAQYLIAAMAAAVCVAGGGMSATLRQAAQARPKHPIKKIGLIEAIKTQGMTPAELAAEIQARGVDFQVTPDAEREMSL